MEEFESKFYENENLLSMKISENISMAFIYENLKLENNIFEKEGIKILNHKNGIFDIQYKDIKLEYILEEPIKVKIKNKTIDIISVTHLQQIIQKYNIINPKIKYKNGGSVREFNLRNLILHKNDEISIESSNIFTIIQEIDFNDFFSKEAKKEDGCLGKTFKNPVEFEKNFEFYFKDYEKIYKNKPFILYKNEKRESFINILKQEILLSIGRFIAYFGQSGMGKSIVIIIILKYITNHIIYGTLYLNMKCLKILIKNKEYKKLKQIIIDELPYLFYQRYNKYLECISLIDKFALENEESIWNLISKIIEFILDIPKDKRKYIFIFDQYNDKIDKNDKLNKIYEEFSRNKTIKSLGIISLSSMNNNDIKQYKINYIKEQIATNFNYETNDNKTLEEFKEIFDFKGLKFDDDSYEEYFELLGRNIKNYNILNDYFINQKNIEDYINETKENIKSKIKLFYNCDIDERKSIQLLYFSTTTIYDLDSFTKISKYVPFKYFIPVIKLDDNDKQYIQINLAFPLMEEVINELQENILYYEFNIYKTLCNNNLIDGGARGQMFEKFFTFHLNPNIYKIQKKLVFRDIDIKDTIKLKKFIPKDNEKIRENKKKETLAKGDYLFIQKILNGKDLDILIVSINEDNWAIILAFQITIHKPDEKIFTKKYLKTCFHKLKNNLLNLYDFKLDEQNIYFSYIFDKTYETKENDLFNKMINKCSEEGISYMIFDPLLIELYSKNNQKVEYLGLNALSPYREKSYKRDDLGDHDKFELFLKKIPENDKMSHYNEVQSFEIQIAIELLKKDTEYGNTIKELKFVSNKAFPKKNDFKENEVYMARSIPTGKLFMIYFSKTKKQFIHSFLNGKRAENYAEYDFFQYFDVYMIITESKK